MLKHFSICNDSYFRSLDFTVDDVACTANCSVPCTEYIYDVKVTTLQPWPPYSEFVTNLTEATILNGKLSAYSYDIVADYLTVRFQ